MAKFTPTEQALLDLNTKLRAENAALKRKAETDEGGDTKDPKQKDLPGYDDTSSSDDDDMEIGEDGKLRPKKRKPVAGDDETPNDTRDEPNKSNAKIFALMVVNSGLKARGLKPLKALAQDETVLPADGRVPTDPESFAKCCINAARKARGQPPLPPNEFVSIRQLRGGR
jgi:hypothetical protein